MSTRLLPRPTSVLPSTAEAAMDELCRIASDAARAGHELPCRTAVDPDAYFPVGELEAHVPAELCDGCPALQACAWYAEVAGEQEGVWGGRLLDTRRQYQNARRAARKANR